MAAGLRRRLVPCALAGLFVLLSFAPAPAPAAGSGCPARSWSLSDVCLVDGIAASGGTLTASVTLDPGQSTILTVYCCRPADPTSGDPLVDDYLSVPPFMSGTTCAAGSCQVSLVVPPGAGLAHDGTARCQVNGGAGVWSCMISPLA